MKHPKFLVCLLRPFSTPWEEPGRTPLTSRSRTSSTKSTTGPGPSMWTTSSWSWGSPVEISTARSISRMLSEPSARIKMVPCFIFHIHLLHFIFFVLIQNTIHISGCIPAAELKFVMNHLPGQVGIPFETHI